jgi:membrane protease YdiL (CAAX protease family)
MSVGTAALGWLAPPELPFEPLQKLAWLSELFEYPPVKALLPIPVMLAVAPAIWWVFRGTWATVNREAAEERAALPPDHVDYRPMVCLLIVGLVLTIQEYYGGRRLYSYLIRGDLLALERAGLSWIQADKYDELYGYAWWVLARILGYAALPLAAWKILFPKDSLLDMGLRIRGITEHWRLYALCLGIVLPLMLLVSQQPDFGNYYPFYKLSARSWFDFLAWEAMYWAQFFALELFFRGWMLQALRRSMGAYAIFVMALPYCMIHFGKPYLEAHGAVVAGVVLGSLAMRTRSIFAGFLVHITVAVGMDLLSLWKRGALPGVFWPPG